MDPPGGGRKGTWIAAVNGGGAKPPPGSSPGRSTTPGMAFRVPHPGDLQSAGRQTLSTGAGGITAIRVCVRQSGCGGRARPARSAGQQVCAENRPRPRRRRGQAPEKGPGGSPPGWHGGAGRGRPPGMGQPGQPVRFRPPSFGPFLFSPLWHPGKTGSGRGTAPVIWRDHPTGRTHGEHANAGSSPARADSTTKGGGACGACSLYVRQQQRPEVVQLQRAGRIGDGAGGF